MKRAAAIALALMATPAAAGVISFDPNIIGSPQAFTDSQDLGGFLITGGYVIPPNFQSVSINNGTNFAIYGPSGPARMSFPGSFTLLAVDLGLNDFFSPGATATINIVGQFRGGGTIAQSVFLTDSFQTFALPGFVNLETVIFGNIGQLQLPYIAMDNIAFDLSNSVPEPSTWALMLFGFAFLGMKNIWPPHEK